METPRGRVWSVPVDDIAAVVGGGAESEQIMKVVSVLVYVPGAARQGNKCVAT